MENKTRGKIYLVGGIAIGIIVTMLVLVSVIAMRYPKNTGERVADSGTDITSSEVNNFGNITTTAVVDPNLVGHPSSIVVSTGTDKFGRYEITTDAYNVQSTKDYSVQFVNNPITVKWNRGAIPLSDVQIASILKKIDPTIKDNRVSLTSDGMGWGPAVCDPTYDRSCNIYIYELGSISKPDFVANKKVYLLSVPGYGTAKVIYDDKTNKFITLLDDGVYGTYAWSTLTSLGDGIIRVRFAELDIPKTLSVVNENNRMVTLVFAKSYVLQNENNVYDTGIYSNVGGIANIADRTMVSYTDYIPSIIRFQHAKNSDGTDYGPVYAKDGGFHIILPDGSVQIYDLLPDFMTSIGPNDAAKNMYLGGYRVHIAWTDGRSESADEAYILGGTLGSKGFCSFGVLPCTNIIDNEPWFSESKLVAVGKTQSGDIVYEMNDGTTNPFYKALFDYGYIGWKFLDGGSGYDSTNINDNNEKMKDFLVDHPLFFWKDYDGHWRVYQKNHYQSQAECGKPVIYLYPEKDTTVHVAVAPTGGFTKTEPEYGTNGWSVRATPQSVLTNLADGKMYTYLFWEGRALNYVRPTEGFVIKREDVGAKMHMLLEKLGLNEKETNDFLEFWQPKLETKPYVFVTFVPQSQFNQMAPLNVTPAPETVIRVFMDYQPLEQNITVKPLVIKTPERKGFTVVEWGGALHK